ncbi:MAG: SURF1 family protein, partial [Pseudomonadota bacterium]|nr:SURF1 family protein [Pseudomonadota bacterium]
MSSFFMRHFGFQPTLWPTLFTVPALVVILALGFWQLQRLQEKLAVIEAFEARVTAPAVAPPPAGAPVAEIEFQRVSPTGRYLADTEGLILGRPFDGNTGFHLVVPFALDDGRVILINRGWIPEKFGPLPRRPARLAPPRDSVTVNGLVHVVRPKGRFVPDNEPGRDMWFTITPSEIGAAKGLDAVATYYIDRLRPTPRDRQLPIGASTEVSVRNDHLQYAITWFSFAISLAVIYVL